MSVGSATELDGLAAAGAVAAHVLDVMLGTVESGMTPVDSVNDAIVTGDGPLVVTAARPYLLPARTSPAQA